MSFRYDEKLPTFKFDLVTTNLKDDNKNCTKSENLKQLYDEILSSVGNRLKKSSKNVNNPTISTKQLLEKLMVFSDFRCKSNVDDEIICKDMMPIKTFKTFKKFENNKLNKLKLNEMLKDSEPDKYCRYPDGKCIRLTNCLTPIPCDNHGSNFKMFKNNEITNITLNFLTSVDDAMKMEFESRAMSSLSSIDSCPQTNQNSDSIELSKTSPPQIKDGRLFFENVWYRTGQHVDIEGEFLMKFSAVICGIGNKFIWVLKTSDNSKFCFHIDHLVFGEMSIVCRIIPAGIIQSIMNRLS